MIIAGIYSFNNGQKVIESEYRNELEEVKDIIRAINSEDCKTKRSQEKTMVDKLLYSPRELNNVFKYEFELRQWEKYRVPCDYPTKY
jgi:methylphosphotriester-DNA--protein-cysteine methyltransferase